MTREFCISEKHSEEWLLSQGNWGSTMAKLLVARDIITNAEELEPKLDWELILDSLKCNKFEQQRLRGERVIAETLAATIGAIAGRKGWAMHSPGVVYMGGYYFLKGLSEEVGRLDTNLRTVEDGSRRFTDPEKGQATVALELQKMHLFSEYRGILDGTLKEFADGYLLVDGGITNAGLALLQRLVSVGQESKLRKEKVYGLIKERRDKELFEYLFGPS